MYWPVENSVVSCQSHTFNSFRSTASKISSPVPAEFPFILAVTWETLHGMTQTWGQLHINTVVTHELHELQGCIT